MIRAIGDPFVVVEEEESVEGVVEDVQYLLGGAEGDEVDELDDSVLSADGENAGVIRAGKRVDLRLALQFLSQRRVPDSE